MGSNSSVSETARPLQLGADRFQGLDGLRGMALLTVIVAHLNLFGAGWAGMQSFFVLSGFLITRILLSDHARAPSLGAYFKQFYIRRMLRVLPIYYGYLLALALATVLVPAIREVRQELPAAAGFYYNFHMMWPHVFTRTLSHLWSMSVEEQFYFIWPWLVAFVPRRAFPYLCIAIIGISPLVRLLFNDALLPALGLGGPRQPILTYISTFSYLDAFAIGALLNFAQWQARVWQLLAFAAGMLVLGFAVNGTYGMNYFSVGWPLFMPHAHQYAWGYSVVNVFLFLLISAIVTHEQVRAFFAMKLWDWLGKRSYSSYVIHFPLLALMDPLWHGWMDSYGRLGGTLLFCVPYFAAVLPAGALMYRYIEMPANALKEYFRPRGARAPAAAGVAAPDASTAPPAEPPKLVA